LCNFRVDASRIKDVGPDRACAEWLLRCGAGVRWQNSKSFVKDYNSLPHEGKSMKIIEIDATDSAVMNVGFPHFRKKEMSYFVLKKNSSQLSLYCSLSFINHYILLYYIIKRTCVRTVLNEICLIYNAVCITLLFIFTFF
jgi:hypothetical protein